jgi:hypothetical protein
MLTKKNTVKQDENASFAKNKTDANKKSGRIVVNGAELRKGDVLRRYYSARNKHYFYGVVSFFMTAMFYIAFTSPGWINKITGDSMSNAIASGVWATLGLLFSIVITILILHSHTRDKDNSRIWAYALILSMGIVFNVFTETASTMDRVDERVKYKSENSGVFKALTNKITHSSGMANAALTKARNDYADAISTANRRCPKSINGHKNYDYSPALCRKWTMRADEYKTAINLHKDGAKTELSETVKEATKASNNTEYAQMVVRMIMQAFGLSFIVATALISLFIIATFELLGMMIGGDYRRYRNALPAYGINLFQKDEINYLKKSLDIETKKDEAILNYNLKSSQQRLDKLRKTAKRNAQIKKIEQDIKKLSPSPAAVISTQHQAAPNGGFATISLATSVTPSKNRASTEQIPSISGANITVLPSKNRAKTEQKAR